MLTNIQAWEKVSLLKKWRENYWPSSKGKLLPISAKRSIKTGRFPACFQVLSRPTQHTIRSPQLLHPCTSTLQNLIQIHFSKQLQGCKASNLHQQHTVIVIASGGRGNSSHLNEEVPRPEPRLPGHSPLINRLQVLQRREGRRGGKLLDGCIRCAAEG